MTETAILKTAAHELTHFIQANSAQYEALKSFVVNKLTHEEGVSFEDLVADKQRREPGLEYDEAVDEVVADACEMMLGDSTVVEQLAKENRSLAEKIRDWLREWVENLKIALEGLQADRTESRAMMQYARELQEIWDNALMDAARNNRGTMEAESRLEAVNADERVRFQQRDSDVSGIKDQNQKPCPGAIKQACSSANVQVENLDKMAIKEKRRWAENVLKSTGYKVDRQGFGTIVYEPRHINEGLNYLKQSGEIAAFAALPQVLKRGEIIERHDNHKGRNFGTVTIAAPVMINGVRGNMAAVVQMTGKNHYHTHRILMPDGSVFEFKQKNSTDSKPAGATPNTDAHATPMDSVHNSSIRSLAANSQEKSSEKDQNQQREPRLSDRDVLRMAADMAQRDRNQRWSVEDLNRFDLLQRKLLQLDEANAELETLKEERKVLLAGRKVKELTRDEQFDLAQNRNRTETQKGKMFVNRIQRVARNNIS